MLNTNIIHTPTGREEAWRFTPIPLVGGGVTYTVASIPYAPIPYQSSAIYWYNASTGAYLGTGSSIAVCPTTRTTYKAGALGCADTSFGYYTVNPTGSIVITTTSTSGKVVSLAAINTTVAAASGGLSALFIEHIIDRWKTGQYSRTGHDCDGILFPTLPTTHTEYF